jgi:hypothetical protein
MLTEGQLREGASGRVDEQRVCVYVRVDDSELLAVVNEKNKITKHAQVEL